MSVCCPRDGKKLLLKQLSILLAQKYIPVVIGTCPHCHAKFINRQLIEGCSFLTIDKIRYEILPELNNMIPYISKNTQLKDIEKKIQKKVSKAERQQQKLKIQKELEKQRQLAARQEELQKKQKEHELKKSQRKIKEQEYIKQNQKMQIERFSKEAIAHPRKIPQPTAIAFYNHIFESCPYDQSVLLDVQLHQVFAVKTALYCKQCKTLFLPEYLQSRANIPQLKHRILHNSSEDKKTPAKKGSILGKQLHTYTAGTTSLPDSTIFSAKLHNVPHNKDLEIVVVSNEHQQDTSNGIYWIGRSLPSMILTVIQLDSRKQFTYKNIKYYVKSYEKYLKFESYANTVTKFCNPLKPQTIHVFAQKNMVYFQSTDYELVTAMIPCEKSSFPVPISVYYDKTKHMYFMNEESYTLIREKYGLPYLRIQPMLSQHFNGKIEGLRAHSELYLLGYRVDAKTGNDVAARRQILKRILDSGILRKLEVMNHLEWLVHTRTGIPHMENAVSEWKADLYFVSTYNIDSQRKIWVNKFKAKCDLNKKR